ncbi:MAG: HAD family phosphatase [Candidatus Peribacteraceae bacterium]|nr:HAD family phosphatase [Candidatus Peribacteraceae bacterium]
MKFAAILFDLDGTLIHTTHLYEEACIAGMRSIGLPFSPDDFRRLYPTSYAMTSWITDKGGDAGRIEEVRTARDLVYHELLSTRSEYCSGATNILTFLKDHPTGVVTNSWRSYLDAIHKKLSIYDRLTEIVTADDMGDLCKPHPHGLLMTADKLKADPKNSIYIGDQIFDLEAARAAGMTACLVRGPHSPEGAEKHADIVVESLLELQTRL